jgi:hypothetical protein
VTNELIVDMLTLKAMPYPAMELGMLTKLAAIGYHPLAWIWALLKAVWKVLYHVGEGEMVGSLVLPIPNTYAMTALLALKALASC